MNKYLVGTCVYNEGEKIRRLIQKLNSYPDYDFVIVDDASTDNALKDLAQSRSTVIIRSETRKGAGYGVRKILSYASDKGYEAVFFISGNDKDDPADLCKLHKALDAGFDFVQGSRYLPGGVHGKMPFYRRIATQFVHPFIF